MLENKDYYWYKSKEPHSSVFNYVKHLDNHQQYRQLDNIKHMRLYGNSEFVGLNAYNYARTESSYNIQNRVTLNIVQSMVDTVTSKIGKLKPRPMFLTDGGDWSTKRKGEKLTKFVDGIFYATNYYNTARLAFKDACIFGTGAMKFYIENGKLKSERVFIDELRVDDQECLYGKPRQMHQLKWIHKDVLKASFPKYAGAIEASMSVMENVYSNDSFAKNGDMILVVESWRLPSGADKGDGKHTICIANQTLIDEKWEKDYFPFVFMRWNDRPIGFFGQGISEQLSGLQLEINKILRTIQVSMHLVSVPKIFMEASSKIVTAHLNNKIGGIIKYVGTPPQEGKLGSVPSELFMHLDRLYNRAYEIVGVSQLSAQSQKPSGLDSGKALRTYSDIESERFQSVQKMYEQSFLEAAKIFIDLAKEVYTEVGEFKVQIPAGSFVSSIDWAQLDLEEDQYIMQLFPTNALSQEPSSRLQEVQELMQAGLIGREDGMKLLDYPDLKAHYNMANAGIVDIERQLELMVENGEYQTPEPYQNLAYGITKMQQAYLHYRSEGAPEEVLELLRRWMADANELVAMARQEQMQQEAMAQQAAMPPMAEPQAPPVSDLVPNVPVA